MEVAIKPKFCRDCKYRDHGPYVFRCLHVKALRFNLVTGEEMDRVPCGNMRAPMGGACGLDAELFEAKP